MKFRKILVTMLIISMFAGSTIGCSSTVNQSSLSETNIIYTKGIEQTTTYGKVVGKEENEGKTLLWQGIPYAKPPVGDLRWKAPQDVEKWNGIFDATRSGAIGIQSSNGEIIGSEDCLNLDIYRPNTDENNLPVLLFIHGGNNQSGKSTEIDGRKLAVNTNCIVVSVNYRLGVLGFNNLPALKTGNSSEDSGNYTLLDIEKSLEWINKNIEAFGGDSNNITAAGFSAGGRDIMAMLISTLFEGKFQKAIAFSGGMTVAEPDDSASTIAKAIASLVVEDGWKEDEKEAYEWLLTDKQEVTDYLYSISAERLAGLMGNAAIRMNVFPHLYTDGVILPSEGFETTKYNDVPLIMLTSSGEFSLFARNDSFFAQYDDNTLLNDDIVSKEFDFAVKYGSELYELFNAEESATNMFEDYNAPIYTCNFEWGEDEKVVGEEFKRFVGAYHGVFLPFLTETVTGYGSMYPEVFDNSGVRDLSEKFTSYIKNFLWDGDPNGDDLVIWEMWTSSDKGPSQLIFNADKNNAIIEMSNERVSYDDILEDIEVDMTISEESKEKIIKEVLNGRWFSKQLDEYFEKISF